MMRAPTAGEGLITVVQGTLLGSILSNLLLVLGTVPATWSMPTKLP